MSSQTADATIGFVAENTENRVSSVASPNVSKHTMSPSWPTASWHAGVLPSSTSARAASSIGSKSTGRVSYGALALVQLRGGATVAYPLEVGGVDDYRMKVGSMLLTLVD